MKIQKIYVNLAPIVFFLLFSSAKVCAELIMFSDYFPAGEIGDTWEYENIDGSNFTWELSQVTTGVNAGRLKRGNATSGIVYDVQDEQVTWYSNSFETDPDAKPVIFSRTYETGQRFTVDDHATKDSEFLFLLIPNLTVKAGTFDDILIQIWLDSDFLPNTVNDLFGLDPLGITAGVTDIDWYARGIGSVKYMGVQAEDGLIDGGYELISSTIVPEPNILALMILSLIILVFWHFKTNRKHNKTIHGSQSITKPPQKWTLLYQKFGQCH